jgi:hypothetical protein
MSSSRATPPGRRVFISSVAGIEPGEQAARGPLGGQQLHLRAGVVQHVSDNRMPFGVVAVQQPLRRPAGYLGGQFPAEVERVLDGEV